MRKARIYDARQLPAYLSPAQYAELMSIDKRRCRRCAAAGFCLPKRWDRGCGALTRTGHWNREN